ncbi:MAG TPA: AMP-binding protein [Mycobacteriales bacterium]|nr:AMP-binding protein [Mycobacteriales bacterium]
MRWLADRHGVHTAEYEDVWRWSVGDLEQFWSSFAEWARVRWHTEPGSALTDRTMPGARWFPGARLNYAEHLLFPPGADAPGDLAVIFAREDGLNRELSRRELRDEVAAVAGWLRAQGVCPGDRVAGLLPNCPEALIAMIATTAIGAIWSSCSPDFGPRAVVDRFAQIQPTILIAVDGYRYGGRSFTILDRIQALCDELPSLQATVLLPYPDANAALPGATTWADLLTSPASIAFESMPFDAPLWILYSSGTTGLPKPIVHSHGGILLEHMKQLALHLDIGPTDRFL